MPNELTQRRVLIIIGIIILTGILVWMWLSTPGYYDNLKTACGGDQCCIQSVATMKSAGYKQMETKGCDAGYAPNKAPCGTSSLTWCQPVK